MSIYIDLSEFLVNPIRTGIQRISGEICRYLSAGDLIPIRLSSSGYVRLSTELIGAIARYFGDAGEQELSVIRRLGTVDRGSPFQPSPRDVVLVPEVFDNAQRLSYFREKTDRELQSYRFIVYDLLPITHPEYFPPAALVPIYGYYSLLRRAPRCGFISEYTRDTYYHRLKRAPLGRGVVLPLGCDALGTRTSVPHLNRPLNFSVIGTVEPRKNHELILNAFEPLLNRIPGLTLSFVGRMGWVESAFAQRVRDLAASAESGFRFYSAPDDGAIRHCIEQSCATIYVSAAEGYGLPPVESLWVGTPVIASTSIPSLERLGRAGIHVVSPLNEVNLRRAILAFADANYANQKTLEACALELPTWRSFAKQVFDWCSDS